MKSLHFTRTIVVICLSFLIFSCQNDQELLEQNNTTEAIEVGEDNETDLVTFNFANGNSFIIYRGFEESEPYIATTQSGSLDNKVLIDVKNNSLLQIYLSLTSEETPIPEILVKMSTLDERKKLPASRSIVTQLEHKVFTVNNYPEKLAIITIQDQKSGEFCNIYNELNNVHQCTNSSYSSLRYQSHKRTVAVRMYTEVFHDSPGSVKANLTVGRRKKSHSEHIIQPGYWAERSRFSVLSRKRGSYRFAPYGEHWRGYTMI